MSAASGEARPYRSKAVVLIGVDGSDPSLAALEWASDEAWLRRASLQLVCAGPPASSTSPTAETVPAAVVVAEAMALVAGRHPGLAVEGRPVARPAAAALVETSSEADLLVVGARGNVSGLGSLPLGSVARHCLRHARCPLTVARSGFADPLRASAGNWIVVGIDGSAVSDLALRWAIEEAADRSTSVRAVFVRPPPVGDAGPSAAAESLARAVVENAVMDAGQWGPRVRFEAVALSGPIAPTLLDAGHGADLVVVGSRGSADRGSLGSVARLCAYHANGPVVIVRPGDEPFSR